MTADQNTWSLRSVLDWSMVRFQEMGFPTPLLDAQLLLAHALGCEKIQLYLEMERPLTAGEREAMRNLVKRRLAHEPVAYILGKQHWHDLELYVDHRVLIPRPETETLLDVVLALTVPMALKPVLIFDFCTGSGCLAIALARKFPEARVLGIDVSEEALQVARQNALAAGATQVEFLLSDLTRGPVYPYLRKQFGVADICVANPPYVTAAAWESLEPNVRDYEPHLALVGGDDGLSVARTIWNKGREEGLWSSAGIFAMELGEGQPESLLRQAGAPSSFATAVSPHAPARLAPEGEPFVVQDYAGKERFLFVRGTNSN